MFINLQEKRHPRGLHPEARTGKKLTHIYQQIWGCGCYRSSANRRSFCVQDLAVVKEKIFPPDNMVLLTDLWQFLITQLRDLFLMTHLSFSWSSCDSSSWPSCVTFFYLTTWFSLTHLWQFLLIQLCEVFPPDNMVFLDPPMTVSCDPAV